jgi:uncharacterized BrkB/YihY/UPF0761 family membrane protein
MQVGFVGSGMVIGSVGLAWLDWGWLLNEHQAINDAYAVEEKTGTEINSFKYYKQGVLSQLRFILCYLFVVLVGLTLIAKDHGYTIPFTAL